jgi:hypothetical protein
MLMADTSGHGAKCDPVHPVSASQFHAWVAPGGHTVHPNTAPLNANIRPAFGPEYSQHDRLVVTKTVHGVQTA